MLNSLTATSNTGDFLHFGNLEIFAEFVFGRTAQHQDTFCDFIHFLCGIVVHIFKFAVQHEEPVSFNIPMETAQVGIMYLKVCQ